MGFDTKATQSCSSLFFSVKWLPLKIQPSSLTMVGGWIETRRNRYKIYPAFKNWLILQFYFDGFDADKHICGCYKDNSCPMSSFNTSCHCDSRYYSKLNGKKYELSPKVFWHPLHKILIWKYFEVLIAQLVNIKILKLGAPVELRLWKNYEQIFPPCQAVQIRIILLWISSSESNYW